MQWSGTGLKICGKKQKKNFRKPEKLLIKTLKILQESLTPFIRKYFCSFVFEFLLVTTKKTLLRIIFILYLLLFIFIYIYILYLLYLNRVYDRNLSFPLFSLTLSCSPPGPTPTACLCWRWRTWWSWATNQTPNVFSPTCSLWLTTCEDMRCPWVAPVTSDLWTECDQTGLLLSSLLRHHQKTTWEAGSKSCTSLMDKLGIVCVCDCTEYIYVGSVFNVSSGLNLVQHKVYLFYSKRGHVHFRTYKSFNIYICFGFILI